MRGVPQAPHAAEDRAAAMRRLSPKECDGARRCYRRDAHDAHDGVEARELRQLPRSAHVEGRAQRMHAVPQERDEPVSDTQPARAQGVYGLPRCSRSGAERGRLPEVPRDDEGNARGARTGAPQGLYGLPQSPRATTRGDAALLRVVLDNLLGNAWKFTGRRDGARIEFGVSSTDGHRAYFVRDNGAGFDMAFASKLFGVFQRLHAATDFEGTGV